MPTSAVLIIANPFESRMVARAVEQAGLRPVSAEDGDAALALLEQERPSVVVLAQGLLDGHEAELLEHIRGINSAAAIVLILDGNDPDPRMKADEVIGRPINPTQLAGLLADLARRVTDESAADDWFAPRTPQPEAPPEEPEQAGDAPAARSGVDDDAWWVDEVAETPPTLQLSPITAAEIAAAERLVAESAVAESNAATVDAGAAGSDDSGDADADIPTAVDVPRPSLLRMDDALADGLFAEPPRPAARRTLEQQLANVEKTLGSRGQHPAFESRLSLDTLPGLDAELGFGGPLAALMPSGTNGGVAPARANPPLDAALARLIPGRDAQIGARTISHPSAAPELDEAAGMADFPDSGDLARENLPELMARLHRAGFTGRLVLRRGEGEKALYFDGGFPVHASSSLPHDRLGELLWREGRISKEQNLKARALAEKKNRRIVDALVEIQALRREELFKVLRHHAEEIIYSCFGWDRGGWSLGRETARRDEKVSIAHPYAIAMEGIRRKYGLDRLVQLVGDKSVTISSTPSLWRISADSGLSPSEREAVQSLRRGPRSVDELQHLGRLDEIGAYALAHGLLALGAVTRSEAAAATDTREEGAGGDDPVIDRERAIAKHAQVLDGDYFAVLGVSRSASAYEVKRAYERMRSDFVPERFEAAVQAELKETLAEIAEVVEEAWRALGDDRLRETYRSHLVE